MLVFQTFFHLSVCATILNTFIGIGSHASEGLFSGTLVFSKVENMDAIIKCNNNHIYISSILFANSLYLYHAHFALCFVLLDQQEVLWKGKRNSEFRQERMCEFDMDLNVSLEEEMDCEFYGEPRNQDTQLIPNAETQLVNEYQGWHGETQLISTPGKEFLGNVSSSHVKAVATDTKEMPCETRGDVDSNKSKGNAMLHGGTKASSSSGLDLPSITTESKLLAIPSASEASEGSPFQTCVGTVHAESIRLAAMQPLTWLPKQKVGDHSSPSLPVLGNRRDAGKSVYRPELPSSEPEWMRDYGSKGDSQGKKNQEERIGAPGSSSVPEFSFPKDTSKAPGILTSRQTEVVEQGMISPQASISGMRSLFGTSYKPGAPYKGTSGTLGGETRFSQLKTALPPRSSFGPRLPSPTSSMNYLDSVVLLMPTLLIKFCLHWKCIFLSVSFNVFKSG